MHFLTLKSTPEALNEHLSDGSRSNSSSVAMFKGQTAMK